MTEQLRDAAYIGFRRSESALNVPLEHLPHVVRHPAWGHRAHLLLPRVKVVACVDDLFAQNLAPQCGIAGTIDLRGADEIVSLTFVTLLCQRDRRRFGKVARVDGGYSRCTDRHRVDTHLLQHRFERQIVLEEIAGP